MQKGSSPRDRADEAEADCVYAETDPTGRYGRVSNRLYTFT